MARALPTAAQARSLPEAMPTWRALAARAGGSGQRGVLETDQVGQQLCGETGRFFWPPRVVARHSLPSSADGDGVRLSLVKNWRQPHKRLTHRAHFNGVVERPMGRGERVTGPRGGNGQGSSPRRRRCGRTTRRKTRRCLPPDWRASALREARRRCHLWLCDCCVLTGRRCRWFDSCFTRSRR